jgi:hypothetical protein
VLSLSLRATNDTQGSFGAGLPEVDQSDPPGMADETHCGRLIIEWNRNGQPPPDDLDWRVRPEPPGALTDEEISRLLREISDRM